MKKPISDYETSYPQGKEIENYYGSCEGGNAAPCCVGNTGGPSGPTGPTGPTGPGGGWN